ncbi:MAG: hypothetical protein EZS28_051593, partial [Streblomastix strix]
MLTRKRTHYIRLKQMIKTATFHGMGNLSFKLRFIAFGSDRFATYFDAFEWKQLREEQ